MDRHGKLSILEAAQAMDVDPQFLRIALQQERFKFGIAVKRRRWSYYINKKKFIAYITGTDK